MRHTIENRKPEKHKLYTRRSLQSESFRCVNGITIRVRMVRTLPYGRVYSILCWCRVSRGILLCVRVQMHLTAGDQIIDTVHRPLTELASGTNAQLTSLSLIIDAVDVVMADVEDAVSKVRQQFKLLYLTNFVLRLRLAISFASAETQARRRKKL